MNYTVLTLDEMKDYKVGEAISIAAIMTVLCAAVMAIVIYKMFISSKGSATIPGGWKFTWS